jgi:hypothetical protein
MARGLLVIAGGDFEAFEPAVKELRIVGNEVIGAVGTHEAGEAVDVFGGAALHQAESADEFLEPARETAGKFKFEDDGVPEDEDRMAHLGGELDAGFEFSADLSVEGDADGIIVLA